MKELIRQYNELGHYLKTDPQLAISLPELSPCQLIVNDHVADGEMAAANPNPVVTHAEVISAIRAFQPLQGWLCYQSEVLSLTNGDLSFLDHSGIGWILNGELSNANRESLHISQNGSGQWLLTKYQEQPGEDLLRQTMTYLSTKDELGHLAYAVYWQRDALIGYQKVHSRFLGFQKEAQS
ncbi:hypothetical protein [Leucothrix pacifica]|uniref:Uncharacterized protein n=1 Tax=Leucothrix pacifica TaxID=1247513 RepID=A0A317C107_9GAMM|nr:hypothetical protein [Leucothrix pacifica]PWQ92325.1 hypothetical protein DKW60_21795 [Leucothrix pacifica]